MIPLMKPPSGQTKPIITNLGDGINTSTPSVHIKESQAFDMMNLSSHDYPSMSVRPGRVHFGTQLTAPISLLGARQDDYLLTVANGVWKYWSNAWVDLMSGVGTGKAKVIDFMGKTILVNGGTSYYWDGSTTGTVAGMPTSKYLTLLSNRLFCAGDSSNPQRLSFSALRKYNDWTTVNDSGAIEVETPDATPITCIGSFANHVIVGKEEHVFELYGTGPKNYELVKLATKTGIVSDGSFCEVSGAGVFWLSRQGVCRYTGGTAPKVINDNLKSIIDRINWSAKDKIVSGTDGIRYYLAIPVDNSSVNNLIVVLDTRTMEWYPEDSINVVDFVRVSNKLYAVDESGWVWDMINGTNDNGSVISSYRVSKLLLEGPLSTKRSWYKLIFMAKLPVDSTLKIYLSLTDTGDDWELVGSYVGDDGLLKNYDMMLPAASAYNVSWIRIKIEMTGPEVIHALEKHLRIRK